MKKLIYLLLPFIIGSCAPDPHEQEEYTYKSGDIVVLKKDSVRTKIVETLCKCDNNENYSINSGGEEIHITQHDIIGTLAMVEAKIAKRRAKQQLILDSISNKDALRDSLFLRAIERTLLNKSSDNTDELLRQVQYELKQVKNELKQVKEEASKKPKIGETTYYTDKNNGILIKDSAEVYDLK